MDREGKRQTPGRREQIPRPSPPPLGCLCRTRRSRRSPRRSTNVPARVNARNRGARSSISSRCFANDRRWNPRWSTTCATTAPSCFFLAFTSAAPFDSRDARVPRVPSYPPSERRGSRRTRPRARGAREDTSAPFRPTPTRTFDSNASDETKTTPKTSARPGFGTWTRERVDRFRTRPNFDYSHACGCRCPRRTTSRAGRDSC